MWGQLGSGGSLSVPRFTVVWGFVTWEDGVFAMIKTSMVEK
jgi:hypothetical protein